MLSVYRRHVATCKHKSRRQRNCRCPIWVAGTLHGETIKKSLDLSNWEAAATLVREWEVNKPGGTVTVCEAGVRFLRDAEARKLREGSILKYRQTVKCLEPLAAMPLRQVKVDDIRRLRESWDIAGITMQKRLETVRSFFQFCLDSGWMDANPARTVKSPKSEDKPTLPFSDDQMRRVFEALDTKYLEAHPMSSESMVRRIRAFILVMLNGGIRISDTVFLNRQRIEDGRLFLRTMKTGVPVRIPLPDDCLNALRDCSMDGDYYFSTGRGKVKTWTTEWEERLKKVFVLAGIPEGHSHQLRDTFSVRLLSRGVSVETVAAILGNSPAIVLKHYAPWVKERQIALEEAVMRVW